MGTLKVWDSVAAAWHAVSRPVKVRSAGGLSVEDPATELVFPDGTVWPQGGGVVNITDLPVGAVCAKIYKTSYQNNITTSTPSKVTWDAAEFDSNGFFDNANDRLTIPAGLGASRRYLVCGTLALEGGSIAGTIAYLSKNGTIAEYIGRGLLDGKTDGYSSFAVPMVLSPGDYIEMFVNPGSTSTVDIRGAAGFSSLSIYLLGSGSVAGLDTARAVRTSSDITLNSTSWANVDTGIDIVVPAQAGDVLLVALSALFGTENVVGFLDVATIVSGSPVNYISGGAGGASHQGVTSWRGHDSTVYKGAGGTIQYVVQSGDISGGNVTLRLRYRTASAANKTLYASSNIPLHWSVVNLRAGTINRRRGTAFPTGPASGDEYYRTDVRGGMLFRYDGTRWVSDQLFRMPLEHYDAATVDQTSFMFPLPQDYNCYIVGAEWTFYAAAGGTWVGYVRKMLFDESSYPDVTSRTFTGYTGARWYAYRDTPNVICVTTGGNTGTNVSGLQVFVDETAGAVSIYMACVVEFRLIAT
jgi:hypothetical protein